MTYWRIEIAGETRTYKSIDTASGELPEGGGGNTK